MGIVDEALKTGTATQKGSIVDEALNERQVPFLVKAADFLTGHFGYEQPKPEIEQVQGGYKVNSPEDASLGLQDPVVWAAMGAGKGITTAGSLLKKLIQAGAETAGWASGGVTDVPKIIQGGARALVKAKEAKNIAPRMQALREAEPVVPGVIRDVPIDAEFTPIAQQLLEGGTKPSAKMLPEPQKVLLEPKVSIVDEALGGNKQSKQVESVSGDIIPGPQGSPLVPRGIPNESGVGIKVEYLRDGEVVGTAQLLGEDITNITVKEPYRRQGIGLEILQDMESRGGKVGYVGTEAGKSLMTKAGWEDIGGGQYGSGLKDIKMVRETPPSSPEKAVESGRVNELKQPKEQTFIGWIKDRGGINDESLKGETKQLGTKEEGVIGLINKKTGQAIDQLADSAIVDGWLPEGSSTVDFLELLNKDMKAIKEGKIELRAIPKSSNKFDQFANRIIKKGDKTLGDEVNEMQKKGFSPIKKEMPVGDIEQGDRILIKGEEFTHTGFDKSGNAIIKDGETFKLDPFEQLPVDGIKRVTTIEKSIGESGFISLPMAGRIAGGGIGAAIGYKEDTEHPIRGILFGGALGTLGVKSGELLFKSLKNKVFWQDFKRFWNPESTLPTGYYADPTKLAEEGSEIAMKKASPEGYLDLRGTTRGWIQRTDNLVSRIVKNLEKYDDATRAKMSDWMRGNIDISELPSDAQITAKNLRTMQTEIGKMLVNRGRLNPATFEANKDTYLHNIFAKYLGDAPMAGNVGASQKLQEKYLKNRIDAELWESLSEFGPEAKTTVKQFINDSLPIEEVPIEVQKIAQQLKEIDIYRKSIGQVKDIATEFPLSIAQPLKDIGIHDMFKEIADNPYFTWKPKKFKVGKEVFDITSLEKEIASQEVVSKSMPEVPEVQERLATLKDGYRQAMLNKTEADIPENFKRFPEGKAYGPLSGQVVRREIVDDIVPIFSGFRGDKAISKMLDIAYDIETKSMAIFKASKTAFNIPGWVRNFFSNPSQLLMSGMSATDLPKVAYQAAKHMKDGDEVYGQALRHGLFKANFGTEEISKILKTFEDVPEGGFYKMISKIGDLGTLYGKIDDFWKMTKFTEQVNKGADFATAAREAQKWVMDYSLAHPAIKEARKHFMPFVSYSYKILPLIAESMKNRPWVIPTLFTIPYAIHQASRYYSNLTEEDYTKLKKDLPTFVRKSGSYVMVPWKSPEGNTQWVNLDYYFPWGNFKQMESLFRSKEYGDAIQQIGISNPLMDVYEVYKSIGGSTPPKDPFTKIPIYNNLDNPTEKSIALAEWVYNKYAPPMLTRFGALGSMEKAISGTEDKYGRTSTIPQAALKFGGLNIIAPSPKQGVLERKAMISQAQTDFRNVLKSAKTDEKKKEALEAFKHRMKEINQ
jgi:hypothetical protein